MIIPKLIKESFIFAYHALVINKLRAFLSLLGITIGIFLIISVFTAVDSLERGVRESVATLGDDIVFIEKWPWGGGGDYPWWKYWQRPEPTLSDLRQLEDRWPASAESMCLVVFGERKVEYKSISLTGTQIQAASSGYSRVKKLNLQSGRVITEHEYNSARAVGMIGHEIAVNLFGTVDCIGKEVKIGGRKITVTGVFAKEGTSIIGNSLDNVVVVPVTFGRSLINLEEAESIIMVKAHAGITNEELKDELTAAMRAIHRLRPREESDFALNESSLINSQLDGLFSVIKTTGFIIGLFSILVGGFSIANIMFVSVKERTSLIGIQKSLGAKNYFILLQFLFESVFLCLAGGLLGLLMVFMGSVVFSLILDSNVILTLDNILIGIITSVLIGLISGVIPAYSASRLDPVEAIRAN